MRRSTLAVQQRRGRRAGGAPWEATWNDWEWVIGLNAGDGSAPYSVTKHAVVALSENLYLTLQQRNSLVKVSVLCPGLVRTDIANAERHRPAELRNEPAPLNAEMQAGLAAFKAALEASMPPLRVAEVVFEAIEKEQFYVLPHPEWTEVIQLRTDRLLQMENPQSPMATIVKLINAAVELF